MSADLIGKPIVLDISNVDENGELITDRSHPPVRCLGDNEVCHSGSSFKPVSAKVSMLCCIEALEEGGGTGYADMRAAWGEVPEDA